VNQTGLSYFLQIWNYIDIIPPIGIFLLILLQFITIENLTLESSIKAIVSFFMWAKFLYFFRIFKETGYLIRMILTVMYDMRHFLLVLLIGIFAFADSFLSISMLNEDQSDRFVTSFIGSSVYTYRLILGDFNTDEFGSVSVLLVWILFLLCTVFNMIIMLNLLIAIISESFATVTSNASNAAYQEMSALIFENSYLIPYDVKKAYAK
jgi:hypothetical protein